MFLLEDDEYSEVSTKTIPVKRALVVLVVLVNGGSNSSSNLSSRGSCRRATFVSVHGERAVSAWRRVASAVAPCMQRFTGEQFRRPAARWPVQV